MIRSASFPAGWYCAVPTYDANNNLISGDINCATVGTPYQALHVERDHRSVPQDGAEQPVQRDQFQPASDQSG